MSQEISLVPGRFVVIHPGHIRLLRYAKSISEKVVVALNSAGVTEEEISWRIGALQGIPFVDQVIAYEENLGDIIGQLRPRFVLRGTEFQNLAFPELELLRSYGGELIFSSGSYFYSSEDEISSNNHSGVLNKKSIPSYLERNRVSPEQLLAFSDTFSGKRILVIGDSIVDEIVMCHPLGMSQEEPALVVTPIEKKKFIGGAAIVASHCANLGAKTYFISVRGNDPSGEWLDSQLKKAGVNTNFFIDEHRKTTLKKRFRSGKHTLFRLTELTNKSLESNLKSEIVNQVRKQITEVDAIIFSDFSYGLLDGDFAKEIIEIARNNGVVTAADSQTSSQIGDLSKFYGVTLVTPTEKEARQELKDENSGLVQISEKLRKKLNCQYLLLKLGPDGILLHGINSDGSILRTDRMEALNNAPVDVSGAGDSLLACATLSMTVSDNLYVAGILGSIASAIQVSRVGNIPLSIKELKNEIANL